MKKFLLILILVVGQTCVASDISVINSEETEYTDSVITCTGNVIAVYNKKVISADKISYNEENDALTAEGNVVLKDEFENAYFADVLHSKHNFKMGSIENLKIITSDKTRLAAEQCEIVNQEYVLKNVIYTPCYECNTQGVVTWQLKSKEVIFNPKNHTEYQNVILEVFDVPVMYAPYFIHASSNIKRKSGFLVPQLSYTSQQGVGVVIPYLFAISESQEFIIKPIVTSRIGQVLWGEYGLRIPHGELRIDASIAGTKSVDNNAENDKVKKIQGSGYRGHWFSKFFYEINNHWRLGVDVNLTSDRYYRKRFTFLNDDLRTLESTAFIEGFYGRNYTKIRSSMYQCEYLVAVPKILPMFEHRQYLPLFNGTLNINAVFMNLRFEDGRESQKYILGTSWSKEIFISGGQILEFNPALYIHGLNVSEHSKSDYDSYVDCMPHLHATWKWPLLVKTPLHNFVLTPVIGTSISGNKKRFDSFESPLDEVNITNVFSNNRSISPYNIDYGKRYFYGVHINGYCNSKNIYHIALGESFDLTTPEKRLESSGMKYKRSNLVGLADWFVNDNITLTSNISYSRETRRLDQVDFGVDYVDDNFTFNIMGFKGQQTYYNPFAIKKDNITEINSEKKYKGIMLNAGYNLTPRTNINCNLVFGNRNDPLDLPDKKDSGKLKVIRQGIGLKYSNECSKFFIEYIRENKRGGDLRPETTFRVVVQLKNLG